ncbi:AAA family ATPase [Aquamicrobium lusatiense]|uniref:tyrosine-protein kinase domain-containing protein n=2 Tax=Aquamicrobium TaxID=69278 RepID=UPI0024562E32|nr:tyrosine-protein kinase domain-containing protein [Aquamicrobium lusatiense]MDH4989956.1 AAA family ATPase [Aquamicrobium lusatiense]
MLETNSTPQATAMLYDWKWMLKTLLQRPLAILIPAILCAVLAIVYVALRPSHYTASALLNITNLRLSSSDQNTFYAESLYDPTFLETQVQIIASEPIARAVIAGENLTEAAGGDEQKALKAFRSSLSVQRVGQSNLAQISYVASDPAKAAAVANAVAGAYIKKLVSDRDAAVQTASGWLRDRLRGVGVQAQLVSEATPPVDKSDMRGLLIIAAAGIVGAVAGMVLTLILGFFDRRIRTPEQALAACGAECLGIVSVLEAGPAPGGQGGVLARAPAILSHVLRHPYTPLWQALRYAGVVAAKSSQAQQRIAVTSTFDDEGKTTVATNLALMAASSGKRVLLVDAHPYSPALSRMLAPQAGYGIIEFLADEKPSLPEYVVSDPHHGIDILPFSAAGIYEGAAQLLWSQHMEALFGQAAGYDVIVFDLPPLIATGDIRAASAFVDSFLLVVEWNKVPADEMHAALALVAPVREKLIGTLLNKASLGRIESWFSPEASVIARQGLYAQPATAKDAS